MSCVNQQVIYSRYTGDDGFDYARQCLVPCGKCPACLAAKSREWSMRIMDEVSLSSCACFVTLTYND